MTECEREYELLSELLLNEQVKDRVNEVLDKIRAEIEHLNYLDIEDGSDGYDKYVDRYDVLQIINKYKEQTE